MSETPPEPDWANMCCCWLGGEHLLEDEQGIGCGPLEHLENEAE